MRNGYSNAAGNRRTAKASLGLVVVALGGLALAGCSSSNTLDSQQVDNLITTKITSLAPNAQVTANCPSGQKMEAGATFECPVTVNGQQISYTVTQTDSSGNVTAVPTGVAVLSLDKAATEISAGLTEQVAGSSGWETKCNPEGSVDGIYIAKTGATFECTATGTASGESGTVTITATVKDTDGNITWATTKG